MEKWDEIVFLDDNEKLREVNGIKVIGQFNDYRIYKDRYNYAFVAIEDNELSTKTNRKSKERRTRYSSFNHTHLLQLVITAKYMKAQRLWQELL